MLEGKVHCRKEFKCLTSTKRKEPSVWCKGLEAMNTRPTDDENEELRDSKDINALGLRPRALQLGSSGMFAGSGLG